MDINQDELESVKNRKRLNELAAELGFEGIRITLDPTKTTSPERVVVGIIAYLEAEKNKGDTPPVVVLSSNTYGLTG